MRCLSNCPHCHNTGWRDVYTTAPWPDRHGAGWPKIYSERTKPPGAMRTPFLCHCARADALAERYGDRAKRFDDFTQWYLKHHQQEAA